MSRSLYARAWRVVRSRPELGGAIVVGALMHAFGHALLAALGGLLARALVGGGSQAAGGSVPILHALGRGDALLGLAIAGLLAATVKLVGGTAFGFAEARVAGEVGARLRLDVLDRVTTSSLLQRPRQSDHGAAAIAAMTTHVSDVERGVGSGILAEARAVVALAPLAVLLFVLAPRLAASAASAMVAFGVLVFVTRGALRRAHRSAATEAESLALAADEAVRHADLWVTYGAVPTIRGHLAALGRRMTRTAARLRARGALLSGTSEALGALGLVLVVALATDADRATLVPFAIAFFMAYKPLRELVEARLARARAEDALTAALGEPSTLVSDDAADDATSARHGARHGQPRWTAGELVVDGVVAAHGDHAPVSLRLAPGKIAVIVGPTGAGKTSLLRALLGLERPRAGSVCFGGERLDERGAGPDARPFAWVPQDAPVLAASLDENVRLGAGAADKIVSTPELLASIGAGALAASAGAATLATERRVSGGERQWIAVARALATELPVLLFDEPTSALDPDAQRHVLAALERLRGKRTVIVVTHRPEPIALADVVVRLAPADAPAASGTVRAA